MRRLMLVVLVLALAAGGVAAWQVLRAGTGEPVGETAARLCGGLRRQRTGTLGDPRLAEVSGLAAGRAAPGVLWLHNDSGDAARIYAVAPDGALRAAFELSGAEARDWEDIAAGTGPDGGPVLFLGDIGDNDSERAEVAVYRVTEPAVDGGPAAGQGTAPAERLRLRYPDGAHDAETMLADPLTGDLFLVTKDIDGRSGVYRVPAPLGPGPTTMEKVTDLDLGAGGLATGGDVSPAGDAVVVRTYFSAFVWGRVGREPLGAAFARPPCRAARIAELQGEAIGFSSDGGGFYTVSEGKGAPLDLWLPPEDRSG